MKEEIDFIYKLLSDNNLNENQQPEFNFTKIIDDLNKTYKQTYDQIQNIKTDIYNFASENIINDSSKDSQIEYTNELHTKESTSQIQYNGSNVTNSNQKCNNYYLQLLQNIKGQFNINKIYNQDLDIIIQYFQGDNLSDKQTQTDQQKEEVLQKSAKKLGKPPKVQKTCILAVKNKKEDKLKENDIELDDEEDQNMQEELKIQDGDKEKRVKWCTFCQQIMPENQEDNLHIKSKNHKKSKEQWQFNEIKEIEETHPIITLDQDPSELQHEFFKNLKKRCKRIQTKCEKFSVQPQNFQNKQKKFNSINIQNINRLINSIQTQITAIQSGQITFDFSTIQKNLLDLSKVLNNKQEGDLHYLRQSDFSQIMFSKVLKGASYLKINIEVVKIIDIAIQVLNQFCEQIDNRTYLISTNKIIPLIDLLIWLSQKPTIFIYSLTCYHQILSIVMRMIKHRIPQDNSHFEIVQNMKLMITEYIFCSGLFLIQKQMYLTINQLNYLSFAGENTPLNLLKSVSFTQVIVYYYYQSRKKINEYQTNQLNFENLVLDILDKTYLCGILELVTGLLHQQKTKHQQQNNTKKTMPQTIVCITSICINFLNDVARIDLKIIQNILDVKILEMLDFLFDYCNTKYDSSEDIKDLMNQVILLIGYLSLLNIENQNKFNNENFNFIKKLTNLPMNFIIDKKLKDVSFPTIISIIYNNNKNAKEYSQDCGFDMLLNYIQDYLKKYVIQDEFKQNNIQSCSNSVKNNSAQNSTITSPKSSQNVQPIDFSNQVINKLNKNNDPNLEYVTNFSVSSFGTSSQASFMNSTNSKFFILPIRFPINKWEDAYKFINTFQDNNN